MGRGNVGVFCDYGTQFYVANQDYQMYTRPDAWNLCSECALGRDIDIDESDEWYYDETLTECEWNDIMASFKHKFMARFPSFSECRKNTWLKDNSGSFNRQAVMENRLFYVALEDNEWSVAVELIPKVDDYGGGSLLGLQSRHFAILEEQMKNILLERLPKIHTRCGAWMSGTIMSEVYAQ